MRIRTPKPEYERPVVRPFLHEGLKTLVGGTGGPLAATTRLDISRCPPLPRMPGEVAGLFFQQLRINGQVGRKRRVEICPGPELPNVLAGEHGPSRRRAARSRNKRALEEHTFFCYPIERGSLKILCVVRSSMGTPIIGERKKNVWAVGLLGVRRRQT